MFSEKQTTLFVRFGLVALAAGTFFLGANGIAALSGMGGSEKTDKVVPTVTVNGEGDAYAAPDIATLSFSVHNEAKLQKDASNAVNTTMQTLVTALKAAGLSEKDIKTLSYDLQPQYDYIQSVCPLGIVNASQPCAPGKQQLRGYAVTEQIEITMRGEKNFANAATFVDLVTKSGATDVGQLSFKVENTDKVQSDAREKAIAQAKTKAEQLAGQLGVRLVRIASFNENNSAPYYAGRMEFSKAMAVDASPAPVLPTGQNQYHSNVTITYEIKGDR